MFKPRGSRECVKCGASFSGRRCLECRTQYDAARRSGKTRADILTKKRDYHQANKDLISLKKKAYYLANRSSILNKRLLNEYGITQDDYNRMYTEQCGQCAICRKVEEKLVVDHCHKSGKVRSLLCGFCNSGIGHFFEDVESLSSAIQYIQQHG